MTMAVLRHTALSQPVATSATGTANPPGSQGQLEAIG